MLVGEDAGECLDGRDGGADILGNLYDFGNGVVQHPFSNDSIEGIGIGEALGAGDKPRVVEQRFHTYNREEAAEGLVPHRAEGNEAVAAFVDGARVEGPVLVAGAGLDDPAVGETRRRPLVEARHHLEVADVDVLPSARTFSNKKCCHGADEAIGTTGVEALGAGALEGLATGLAREIHVAADGEVSEGCRTPVCVGAVETEGGDAQPDQARVAAGARGNRGEWAGGRTLDKHIRRIRELAELFAAGSIAEVETEAVFAGVERVEEGTDAVGGDGTHAAGRVARWRLELDDASAVVGEQLSNVSTRDGSGHLQHEQLGKWFHSLPRRRGSRASRKASPTMLSDISA